MLNTFLFTFAEVMQKETFLCRQLNAVKDIVGLYFV